MAREVITANFIGGVWDGHETDIVFVPEFRVISQDITGTKRFWVQYKGDKFYKVKYHINIYRHIINGIYWLNRVEEHEQD